MPRCARTLAWAALPLGRNLPLSPQSGLYLRFVDDTSVVLAPTRWKLRKAVAAVNRGRGALGLAKHPDKTFIGQSRPSSPLRPGVEVTSWQRPKG
jgi:hypothetical protein